MTRQKGHFQLLKKTRFEDLVREENPILPESDLCFQNEDHILQFEYKAPDEESNKYEIKPGAHVIVQDQTVHLEKLEFRDRKLLTSVLNTTLMLNEAKKFFTRLHIYEELERPKKRSVMLYSKPGMGKTSAITEICKQLMAEDSGTVVINWPTSEVDSDEVAKFLSVKTEYTKDCTRLVLIIEDIGGNEHEGHHGPRGVDSAMLELLDGVGKTFKLPTFCIATTNHPENLLEALADRPGRFDLMVELQPPSYEEKLNLVSFVAKRELTPDEKVALKLKDAEDFSIAHLEEIVIRSRLDDKSIPDVINELIAHRQRFQKGFDKKGKKVGFNDFDD